MTLCRQFDNFLNFTHTKEKTTEKTILEEYCYNLGLELNINKPSNEIAK